MKVELIGMKRLMMSDTGHQGVMITVAFGDVLISESYPVTTVEMAKKLNKHIRSSSLPEITGFAVLESSRMIFKLKL